MYNQQALLTRCKSGWDSCLSHPPISSKSSVGETPQGYDWDAAPNMALTIIISNLRLNLDGRRLDCGAASDMADSDLLIARPEKLICRSDRVFSWFGTQSQEVVCLSVSSCNKTAAMGSDRAAASVPFCSPLQQTRMHSVSFDRYADDICYYIAVQTT